MTASQGDLASMSRFIFRAPRWYTSWSFAIVLGAIIGVGAFGIEPEGANFIIDAGPLVTLNDAFEGVFFIGIPTIIASAGTAWVDQRLGGRLSHNRASLLALLCEVVVVAFLGAGGAIALASESLGSGFVFDVLFLGLASIFALRLFVITAISRHRPVVAAIPASIQTVAAATLLFVYSGSLYFFDLSDRTLVQAFLSRPQEAPNALSYAVVPADFVLLGFICLIQAVAVVGFLYAIDRPWRANMGVSVLDFIAGFIGHIAEGSRELEDFFESVGEDAVVPVTVASFRRMDGIEKARWVLPMIHPGPMGEIGGGNLPKRVAQSADGLAFPPHATAGHDSTSSPNARSRRSSTARTTRTNPSTTPRTRPRASEPSKGTRRSSGRRSTTTSSSSLRTPRSSPTTSTTPSACRVPPKHALAGSRTSCSSTHTTATTASRATTSGTSRPGANGRST